MRKKLRYSMAYYSPKDQRTDQLTARISKNIKVGLEGLARLWTELEKERSGDEKAEVTVSDVVNRLLQIGLDGAWAEFGGQPKTEEQWVTLLRTANKHLKSK